MTYYATLNQEGNLSISKDRNDTCDMILDNRDLQNLYRCGATGIKSLPLREDIVSILTQKAKDYLIMNAKFTRNINLLTFFR